MMAGKKGTSTGDFIPEQFTQRVDTLETFKSEFEGVKFYQKVAEAIKESKAVECEIKSIAWQTIKDKIFWIILGVVIFLASIFLKDFVSALAFKAASAIGK